MKIGHLKLQSKYLLAGSNLNSIFLMFISLVAASICGGICTGTQFLLEMDSINSALLSKWAYLPAVIKLILAVIFLVCAILLLTPLRTGREAWFLSTAGGKKPKASRILFWYKPSNAFKSARFWCCLTLLRLMWAFVFLSPGLILFTVCWVMLTKNTIEVNLLIALLCSGSAAILIGSVFFLIASQRYFLSSLNLAKNPRTGIIYSIKKSTAQTEGQCLKIFLFKLSFLPWFMLCVLIFPAAYVWPYYKQCCLRYGLYMTGMSDTKLPMELARKADDKG